ncbi:cupin domain-containing protein [Kamptonema cortianum]|nr:cupin domain-containing protein [Kamptonema cortianum]
MKPPVTHLKEIPAFTTKDGSEIRELLAYRNSTIKNQSLAEARLSPGQSTQEHYHIKTEEIYHITEGTALMRLDGREFPVSIGDSIAILPGQKHKITNTGTGTLKLLCMCAPCYEHDDTVMTE